MSQVSDYNIANASGASVRSDLNAVFDAIKTLNSGGSDPSNTAAFMPYVDTADSNNLKIRNAANDGFTTVGSVNSANLGLLPRAGGTMTGQLLGDDSSVAGSPAYAFDNDTDTGMFRSGANTIGFSTSGTERVSISDAGLDVVNGLPIRLQDSSGSPFVSLKSPSALSGNIALTLPSSITNGGFLQTDGSGNLSFQIVAGVPSGSVFCMAVATVPSGYLECNGAAVSRTTYAALFAIIGTNYGNGDGSSTFNVPDLRGEFVRGFDNGRGVDNGRSINDPQSSANLSHGHSVSASVTDPGHNHATSLGSNRVFLVGGSQHVGFGGAGGYPGQDFSMSNANTGISVSISQNNAGGTEARPRNVAMMYIIKV
jgi:microcystin-dependent protein